jgi:anti-sigma factor RsiW
MNLTREIVKDLLPLYVSGEASADSRALVESFLAKDPELARLADALRAGDLPALPAPSTPIGSGRSALEQTKTLLRRRTRLMALALLFTGLPLSFAFDDTGFRFLLIRDAPIAASASLAVAAALWIAFAVTRKRLRVTGL